jgi:replication-associated recombination protein RarA
MSSLLNKYKPQSLADVFGHVQVIGSLRQFMADRYPTAMLFHGESGVGKTASAQALARDLGLAVDEEELGGYHEIPSGSMGADEVRRQMNGMQLGTLFGSGWKVLVCNEADRMSQAAENIWLDALENLPPRTVVIFTTNAPEKLSRRFRDRCECYHFGCDREELQPHIQALARKVWAGEVGPGEPPDLDSLGMPTLGEVENMHASFRLALQQLSRLVRAAKHGDVEQARKQLLWDGLTASAAEADCPYCGRKIKVGTGARSVTCPRCGRKAELELA